jgi:hypothetical protein
MEPGEVPDGTQLTQDLNQLVGFIVLLLLNEAINKIFIPGALSIVSDPACWYLATDIFLLM